MREDKNSIIPKNRLIIMKQYIAVISFIVSSFFLNTQAGADGSSSSSKHIENLQQKIIEMEAQLTAMKQSKDPWKLRSGMKDHAIMMKESADLIVELADEKTKNHKSCVEGNGTTVGTCDEAEYRLLAILIAHIVNRQNAILERTGIIHNQ